MNQQPPMDVRGLHHHDVGDGGTAKRDINHDRDPNKPMADVTAELNALLDRAPGRADPFSVPRMLETGQRVYDQLRQAISAAQSAHAIERARLVDSYRVRFETVRHEAREAVRKLDEHHEQRMEAGARILAAYDELRQG